MKIFRNEDVLTAGRNRMRWIFKEFENVVVSFSGGKDSTIIFNLALEAAREAGRLPLKVFFLDQEAELQSTIDIVDEVMRHPDVEPYWFQIPFRLFNATSVKDHWLNCWEEGKEDLWVRPKSDISFKENIFGTDRFGSLLTAIPEKLWPDLKTANIGGVRCEESPNRALSLTHTPSYKWVTWGKNNSKPGKPEKVVLYPIYDWTTSDVWKAIHDHGWRYSTHYDTMYGYGVPSNKMRVSSLHHETSIWALFMLQEVDGKTYNRLVARIEGIDMAGKMGTADYFPESLPSMFGSWKEYRDYLLEKLIVDEHWREGFRKRFAQMEYELEGMEFPDRMYVIHVKSILCNDHEGVKLRNFASIPWNVDLAVKNKKRRKAEAEAAMVAEHTPDDDDV